MGPFWAQILGFCSGDVHGPTPPTGDMMDKADALTTSPQAQQQRQGMIKQVFGGMISNWIIPTDVSHDTLAQLRFVIEAIRCGIAIRSFHAVQQASTIAS